jgi:hypothetical protein
MAQAAVGKSIGTFDIVVFSGKPLVVNVVAPALLPLLCLQSLALEC